jgi:hypothetical protein
MLDAIKKTLESLWTSLPIIAGVFLLVALIEPLLGSIYPVIFTGNILIDPLIGALAGSISFGVPVISYVTGGELLRQGASLLAVVAFILSWSSVGIITLPLESACLGRKFALARNTINFISSIVAAVLVFLTIKLLS